MPFARNDSFGAHRALVIAVTSLLAIAQTTFAGTWTPLVRTAPAGVNLMLLLPDGTVMCARNNGSTIGNGWFRLTPDNHGSYINGTWTTLASMADTRLYYPAQVLRDGRVFVAGGEYGTGGPKAEIYSPLTNVWTPITPPANLWSTASNNFYDCNSEILPDGSVLTMPVFPHATGIPLIYNPVTNAWSNAGRLFRGSYQDEASWVKLPDDSILTIDPFGTFSERYIPATNTWVNDGIVPVSLYDPFGSELGGAVLLPNGKAFFLGSTGHTAIYTPTGNINPGVWVAGPDIPGSHGTPDAPADMMITGKVLCAVSPLPTSGNHFPSPTTFYEYDWQTNSFASVGAPVGSQDGIASYQAAMLQLPDGNVLYSHFQNQLYVYTPTGQPLAMGKPTISTITPNGDGSYHLVGTGLNGISEGATYGDDLQMNSNYPLVRIVNGVNVSYGRTFNWSRTSVMTGSAMVSTEFIPPAGVSGQLQVVVNGNGSDFVPFAACTQSVTTLYVKSDAAGANNGTSWANAYTNLQTALSAATPGAQIWIASGTYKPAPSGGSRSSTFQLVNCTGIYGGFVGTETQLSQRVTNADGTMVNATILSGDLNSDDGPGFANMADNSFHVVTGSGANSATVIDGCTISGGNSSGAADQNGAGIYISTGDPSLSNCVLRGNLSAAAGGAGFIDNGSNPWFNNCTIRDNAALNGGGIETGANGTNTPRFANCRFAHNAATGGAGDGNGGAARLNSGGAVFTGCTFSGNTATFRGGAVHVAGGAANISRCNFVLNSATDSVDGDAGAICVAGASTPSIVSCIFAGNTAVDDGGAIGVQDTAVPTIANCLLVGNQTLDSGAGTGGAIATTTSAGAPVIANCNIVANNSAFQAGGIFDGAQSGTPTIANGILWNNADAGGMNQASQLVTDGGPAPTVTYTDVTGGWAGTGNLNTNPTFVGGASGTWTASATYDPQTDQTTLTDTGASFIPTILTGKLVNPSPSQIVQCLVVTNTATTITVWGDISALAISPGTGYQINDYHLQSSSPCIGAGSNAAVPPSVTSDLDGNLRIQNNTVEMGSYEFVTPVDFTPPTPNPMTFSIAPSPAGTTSITMQATQAIELVSPPVQYFFDYVSGSGGHDSSWQMSRDYTDSGLTPNSFYNYRVKARDSANPAANETGYSTTVLAGTDIETPTGVSFGATDNTSIVVNADGSFTNVGFGSTGFYFEMTPADGAGANTWVSDPFVTVTGLTPCTQYTFRVKTRNFNSNETGFTLTTQQSTTGCTGCVLLGDVNGSGTLEGGDIAGFTHVKLGAPGPGEIPECADYGTGTLDGDTALFVNDLLGP